MGVESQVPSGPGLAISKRLLELQGRIIGINMKVGAGGCFFFSIPRFVLHHSSANNRLQQGSPKINTSTPKTGQTTY